MGKNETTETSTAFQSPASVAIQGGIVAKSEIRVDHTQFPYSPGAAELMLEERLASAAAPFLTMLPVILFAVFAYFLYSLFGR